MFKYCDGSDVYSKYSKEYTRHSRGAVILAPPASGKTTYIRAQTPDSKNWIDSDDLFADLGAKWHYQERIGDNVRLNYTRCDYLHSQSKCYGFRILGCLFYDYTPDVIVVLPIETHQKYLSTRPDLNYNVVMEVRKALINKSKHEDIPLFDNIKDAVDYISVILN